MEAGTEDGIAPSCLASSASAKTLVGGAAAFDKLVEIIGDDSKITSDTEDELDSDVDEDVLIAQKIEQCGNIDQLFAEIAAHVNRVLPSAATSDASSTTAHAHLFEASVIHHDHNYVDVFESVEYLNESDPLLASDDEPEMIERTERPTTSNVYKANVKKKFKKTPGQPAFADITDTIFLQQVRAHFGSFMPPDIKNADYEVTVNWLTDRFENHFDDFVEGEVKSKSTAGQKVPFKRTGLTVDEAKQFAKQTFILPENEILSDDEILKEQFSLNDLIVLSGSFGQLLRWLVAHKLVANSMKCACGNNMRITPDKSCRHGIQWRCVRCKGVRATILYGSAFYHTHLDIVQILMLAFCWSRMLCGDFTHNHSRVQSKRTRAKFAGLFRTVCGQQMTSEPILLGGIDADGFSRVVEVLLVYIDESMFFKMKYHKGKLKPIQQWVFGMVERGSNRCVLIPVADRTASTLLRIIREYILPGTIVCSDGWKGYIRMKEIAVDHESKPGKKMFAYENKVVEHKHTFKAKDGTHTNRIEGLWRHAKTHFRVKNGVQKEHLNANLVEFCWRRRNLQYDLFQAFLRDLSKVYDMGNVKLCKK